MADIKFVSYTGRYPNLCRGVFTVTIDGKSVSFGHECGSYDFNTDRYTDDNLDKFWRSGGCIDGDEHHNLWAVEGDWELDEEDHSDYPEEIKAL